MQLQMASQQGVFSNMGTVTSSSACLPCAHLPLGRGRGEWSSDAEYLISSFSPLTTQYRPNTKARTLTMLNVDADAHMMFFSSCNFIIDTSNRYRNVSFWGTLRMSINGNISEEQFKETKMYHLNAIWCGLTSNTIYNVLLEHEKSSRQSGPSELDITTNHRHVRHMWIACNINNTAYRVFQKKRHLVTYVFQSKLFHSQNIQAIKL